MSRVRQASPTVLGHYVGTGRNACATEKACYDFGLVARWLLASVMWGFVAQCRATLRNIA
jgi:hypothetical protein